jgi:hypothetical protein
VSTEAKLYFFEARLPGVPTFICGVLLYDVASDSIVFSIRENWQFNTDEETAEILGGYKIHFQEIYAELGAKNFLRKLTSELHNVMSLSEEYTIPMPTQDLRLYADDLCRMLQAD